MTPWHHRKRERLDGLEPLLLFAKGARVFDVGCHRGLVAYEFVRHGAVVAHGCDIDADKIRAANTLFYDTDGTHLFEAMDLAKGHLGIFEQHRWDIVLMLGVYHKLKRAMAATELDVLMNRLAGRCEEYFAWNGYEDEFPVIDALLIPLGFKCKHKSDIVQHTAIWAR